MKRAKKAKKLVKKFFRKQLKEHSLIDRNNKLLNDLSHDVRIIVNWVKMNVWILLLSSMWKTKENSINFAIKNACDTFSRRGNPLLWSMCCHALLLCLPKAFDDEKWRKLNQNWVSYCHNSLTCENFLWGVLLVFLTEVLTSLEGNFEAFLDEIRNNAWEDKHMSKWKIFLSDESQFLTIARDYNIACIFKWIRGCLKMTRNLRFFILLQTLTEK